MPVTKTTEQQDEDSFLTAVRLLAEAGVNMKPLAPVLKRVQEMGLSLSSMMRNMELGPIPDYDSPPEGYPTFDYEDLPWNLRVERSCDRTQVDMQKMGLTGLAVMAAAIDVYPNVNDMDALDVVTPLVMRVLEKKSDPMLFATSFGKADPGEIEQIKERMPHLKINVAELNARVRAYTLTNANGHPINAGKVVGGITVEDGVPFKVVDSRGMERWMFRTRWVRKVV